MRYNTLLKITRDLGPWYSKIFNTFSQKSGQAVITSYIALQHVTKDYKRLGRWYSKIFNTFSRKVDKLL